MKNFLKIITVLIISGVMLSCQKDNITPMQEPVLHETLSDVEPIVKMVLEVEPSLTTEKIYETIGSQSNTYTIVDVLQFLGMYGMTIPDVTPAFNNYHQDIGVGGSRLGQLSKTNGTLFINNSGILLTDTAGYTFDWYINNVLQCSEANPRLWDLDETLVCDGVVELRLDITTTQGAIYSRTQWAYIDYNYIENCNCIGCPLPFEVLYTFYPNVPGYFYQTKCANFDFNCNQIIDYSDLLTILANFG